MVRVVQEQSAEVRKDEDLDAYGAEAQQKLRKVMERERNGSDNGDVCGMLTKFINLTFIDLAYAVLNFLLNWPLALVTSYLAKKIRYPAVETGVTVQELKAKLKKDGVGYRVGIVVCCLYNFFCIYEVLIFAAVQTVSPSRINCVI